MRSLLVLCILPAVACSEPLIKFDNSGKRGAKPCCQSGCKTTGKLQNELQTLGAALLDIVYEMKTNQILTQDKGNEPAVLQQRRIP